MGARMTEPRAVGRWCLIAALVFLSACGTDETGPIDDAATKLPELPQTPPFNADSAFSFVQTQVDFGPRVPGTPQHTACADWMVAKLKGYGATVIEQNATVTAFNGRELPLRNIIARWNLDRKDRVLLIAHYDTRPFADKDDERQGEPIPGANDGGSGVGILLEIARHMAGKAHGPGVDMLFTDVEDFGQPSGSMTAEENSVDTWALGSQYFSRNPPELGYTARFGILLDMCGARDAVFVREAYSMKYAPAVVARVWKTAAALGHGDRFKQETKFFVGTDDHIAINERLRIPTIDIIEFNMGTNAFHPSWHTHDDDMDVIDRATLAVVGGTVLQSVWQER